MTKGSGGMMDPTFETSILGSPERTQRIFTIQARMREIEDVQTALTEEVTELNEQLKFLRETCDHVLPDGLPAWDNYAGADLTCRVCFKKRSQVKKKVLKQ